MAPPIRKKVKVKSLSHVLLVLLLCPWNFPGKSTGVGCHFLLQGIFPTQGLNPGLPHCRKMLYHLSHQGSPSEQDCSTSSPSDQEAFASLLSLSKRTDRLKTTITKKLIKLITWITALSNSMKPWAITCRATQDGQVMVESSDKMWSTGEGDGKPLQ